MVGHWDGFQPFEVKSRSTGAIEVSVATMAKANRLHKDKVYTVVPSYELPDGRPNSLDPFMEPLIRDLENGFIEGTVGLIVIVHVHSHQYIPFLLSNFPIIVNIKGGSTCQTEGITTCNM